MECQHPGAKDKWTPGQVKHPYIAAQNSAPPLTKLRPMRTPSVLVVLFALPTLAFAQAAPATTPAPTPGSDLLRVSVDSGKKEVLLLAGPFDIEGGGGSGHVHHEHEMEYPVIRFAWPTDGWLRGFRLEVTDGDGNPIDRRLIHHLNLVNFGRRQLFYPAVERTLAVGQETGDITLPATIGVPITAGTPMGLIVAWHNEKPEPVIDVMVRLTLIWSPTNQMPRPKDVIFVYADVLYPIGRNANFDLPAGPSSFTREFEMTVSGRVLGAGGHLHDYGREIRFERLGEGGRGAGGGGQEDAETIIRLPAKSDATGRLAEIGRTLPGIWGQGIRLKAGERYRLIGTYLNPTGEAITEGAMVHLAMMFTPDRLSDWPALDLSNPDTQKDLAFLAARGSKRGEHQH